MRRSSWIVLALAIALLAGFGILTLSARDTTAPALTPPVIERILVRGRTALERRNVEGILDLLSPSGRLLDTTPDKMRVVLAHAFKEIDPGHLTVWWDHVTAHPHGRYGTATFDLAVGQRTATADITYYRTRVTLELEKVRTVRWFGLMSVEEWKISRMDSATSLNLPTDI